MKLTKNKLIAIGIVSTILIGMYLKQNKKVDVDVDKQLSRQDSDKIVVPKHYTQTQFEKLLDRYNNIIEIDCSNCIFITNISNLQNLTILNCSGCTALTTLSNFMRLVILSCSNCSALTTLGICTAYRELVLERHPVDALWFPLMLLVSEE